jgi:hypothetical protein
VAGALLLAGLITSPAAADFLGIETEEDTLGLDGVTTLASLGFDHLRVINVYAAFDDPDDQLLIVFGSPGRPFAISTDGGTGFHNVHASQGGSKRAPTLADLAGNDELHVDSFLTIGNRIGDVGPAWPGGAPFDDQAFTLPGTSGPNDPWIGDEPGIAWMVPNTVIPPGGGGPVSPPQSIAGNWDQDRVLIMRLVVDDGVGITGTFGLMIKEAGGVPEELTAFFTHDPAPFLGETEGDQMGRSLANAGDVNNDGFDDFIVGAPFNDEAGVDAGKFYVYSGLTEELLYSRAGEQPGDRYGWAVAGVGDLDGDDHDDFIVGAPYRAGEIGRAYVYSGQTGHLMYAPWGESVGDRFGYSVSGGQDIDADGGDDFIVGAPRAAGSGRVYVHRGAGGSLLAAVSGENDGDNFGWSVAALGNADGDANRDFVVGAPKNDDGASNGGKAYVFSGATFTALYTVKGKKNGDLLGRAIAAVGDLDADMRDDFVVSSPNADKGSTEKAGRIDAFSGQSGVRLWKLKGNGDGDKLGFSVAAAGDVNGDDVPDVVVGEPKRDVLAGSNGGRVSIRSGSDGAVLVEVEGKSQAEQFGYAVAGLVGVGGVQTGQLIVGAPKSDAGAPNAGRAYSFVVTP